MTATRKVSSIGKKDNIIVLGNAKTSLTKFGFSAEEAAHCKRKSALIPELPVVIDKAGTVLVYQPLAGGSNKHKLNEAARKSGAMLASGFNSNKLSSVTVADGNGNKEAMLAFVEGMLLGGYQFLRYREDAAKERNTLSQINILCTKINTKDLDQLQIVSDATCRARTLVNEPVSFLNAVQIAKEFQKLGKEAGFSVEVFNKAKIESLKMGGLISVNKGSVDPPTFTVMQYKPRRAKNKKPIILVGKGVVYDTGGLSLKPTPNSMDMMKCDMAGSAAVACAMFAIAKAKLPVHVIALVPATDNRPGGNAYVPGDVITMMSGLTVEMLNADAEGRMILADALHYAKRFDPELVLEFSTLTGAAKAAVGTFGIVCMGTASESIKNKLKDSGNNVHERLAEFPFWDEYDDLLKSDIAGMKNIGGPEGGSITAGKFLTRFTNYPYMHFDIAGPAFLTAPDTWRGKGGTGVGVRLLFDFLKRR